MHPKSRGTTTTKPASATLSFPAVLFLAKEERDGVSVSNGRTAWTKQAKDFCRVAAVSASLFVATLAMPPTVPPSYAATTLNEAIVEVSETSYPILRALDPAGFQAFCTKIGDSLLNIKPDKLGKSIELGIDVFDSAPADKLDDFNIVLKEAFGDVSTDSCTLVPLPPMALADRFATVASETVDAEKLKTFSETWKPSLEALKKTDSAICLPPKRASLDKLALAQADLGKTFGKTESQAFAKYTTPILKQTFPVGKALELVSDAKKLTPRATPQDKKDFVAAGKKIELASRLEVSRIEYREKQALAEAEKAALRK